MRRDSVRPARQARTPVRERWGNLRAVGDSFDVGWRCGRAFAERRMLAEIAALMAVIQRLEEGEAP